MDNILEQQLINISKAGAYDAISPAFEQLKKENDAFLKSFYMNICRAYNAGKENGIKTVAYPDAFIASHDYFLSEFPNFKTNVP